MRSPNRHNIITGTVSCVGLEDISLLSPQERRKRGIICYDSKRDSVLRVTNPDLPFLEEMREICEMGFTHAVEAGPLTSRPMQGILLEIHDWMLHSDAIHRGYGQIMIPIQKLVHGCYLSADTLICIPEFKFVIRCASKHEEKCKELLCKHQAELIHFHATTFSEMKAVIAARHFLPWWHETCEEMQAVTVTSISITLRKVCDGTVYEDSQLRSLVSEIRREVELPQEIPSPLDFLPELRKPQKSARK